MSEHEHEQTDATPEHTPRGWWPTREDALAALEASPNCERLSEDQWLIGSNFSNHNNAVNIAQIRLALGYTDMNVYMTSNMFALLVQRVVELEQSQ